MAPAHDTTDDRARSPLEPDLLPFLPFIYLAWSDGELRDAEVTSICGELTDSGVDDDCRRAFDGWLDPDDPPTPDQLTSMLDLIRTRSAGIEGVDDFDIETFAEALTASGRQGDQLTDAERVAVRMLGQRLGLEGSEPTRAIVGSPPSPSDTANNTTTAAGNNTAHNTATDTAHNTATGAEDAPAPLGPPLDVAAVTVLRDGTRHEIRERVRALLSQTGFAHIPGLAMADHRARVLDQTRRLADEGIGRLGFPAEHGGTGTQSDFIGAFSVLGHHDLSLLTKFGVQFGLFGGALMRLGTEGHHAELLEPMMSMAVPGCFAMTETDHGSNVQALETTATFDAATDEFVIDTPHRGAAKDYIGNAADDGRMAVVFAQLRTGRPDHAVQRYADQGDADQRCAVQGYGVHAFVVPIRDEQGDPWPGVTIEDDGPKAGLNGVDNGRLRFDGVRIPRTALLDRFASVDADGRYDSPIPGEGKRFFTTIGTLVGGRIGVGTASISAAETALTIAVRYGLHRRQFGAAPGPADGSRETVLLDYPQHQRRLMPLLATTYAFRFALEHLADDYSDERLDSRTLEGHAAGLKTWASWHANRTIQECREACGGAGYLAENRLGPLKADADIFQTYEGDNTVLAQLVARGLLSDYAQQFNDLGLLGTVRFLANRAVETVRESNPVVIGGADEAELRDGYVDLLRWREEHLVASLASRLRSRIKAGADSADAFVHVQDHAIEAARAHVAHLVVRRFLAVVDAMAVGPERDAMRLLCDLHALSTLEADRGWFAEHNKLTPAASKRLRKLVTSLCAEARTIARPLVDAFAIPDEVLGAPSLIGDSPVTEQGLSRD